MISRINQNDPFSYTFAIQPASTDSILSLSLQIAFRLFRNDQFFFLIFVFWDLILNLFFYPVQEQTYTEINKRYTPNKREH